jgi:uncharacterized LabA/DUF88 family protein
VFKFIHNRNNSYYENNNSKSIPILNEIQAGVDVSLAVKMVECAYNNADILVLLSGDGDYEAAIDLVVNKLNKKFYIAGFSNDHGINSSLLKYSNNGSGIINLDDILGKLLEKC